MSNYVTYTSDKSKKTALILCIFFGLFGFHYFYVGRFKRGLIALLTVNFFMMGWIYDIITILTGKFTDNVGAYLRE